MLKLNANGDLVAEAAAHGGILIVIIPAAELRAAGLVRGEVGISREDAQAIFRLIGETHLIDKNKWAGIKNRLRTALKENEHDPPTASRRAP